jgi:hypothetical protein
VSGSHDDLLDTVTHIINLGFEGLTVARSNITFRLVTPCSPADQYRRFETACRLDLQVRTESSSKTPVPIYRATRRYVTEDGNFLNEVAQQHSRLHI